MWKNILTGTAGAIMAVIRPAESSATSGGSLNFDPKAMRLGAPAASGSALRAWYYLQDAKSN